MPRFSTVVSLALIAAGGIASARTLVERQPQRARDRTIEIIVDLEDVKAVSVRAPMPLDELLPRLKDSGATGVTLPERTLARLVRSGDLFQSVPREPMRYAAPFGRWIYLSSADTRTTASVQAELAARLPRLKPQVLPNDAHSLAIAGDLASITDIGLGFDEEMAETIHASGLSVLPRPVSYDWHERAMIERTIAQAAAAGDGIVAFDGNLILGHEMHLDETLAALEAHHLAFAYFAKSRHQRGDWFIAKRLAPNVILAHQFTPQQMIPEDYHSIAHHWANLALERGVRLFIVNVFRVVHATEPLECLHYLEHIRGSVEGAGFRLETKADGRRWTAAKGDEGRLGEIREIKGSATVGAQPGVAGGLPSSVVHRLSLEALIPAAAGALVVGNVMRVPDAVAVALAGAGAAGALLGAQRLDRARDALEQRYAPTYASKSIALGTAALAPLATVAIAQSSDSVMETLLADGVIAASSAAALAALTSSDEYRLRIEEYRGFDLDLWLPIVGMLLLQRASPPRKLAGVALAAVGWYTTRRLAPDPLARFDAAPAMSHTHHLSAAMRAVGDTLLAIGPRPIRKWAGLAPFGLAVSMAARERGYAPLAMGALIVSAIGHAAASTGFRRPERDPVSTAQMAAKSWAAGALAGLIVAKLISSFR